MSEKQLDFIHIFNEAEKTPDNSAEDIDVSEEAENDPVAFDELQAEQRREIEKAELAKQQREKNDQLKQRRISLLLKTTPTVAEFNEFMPEIIRYQERMNDFRTAYESASQPDKLALYEKMVRPDINDEPLYQDSARLYLKYLEAYREDKRTKQTSSIYEARKTKSIKRPKRVREIDLTRGKNAAAMLDK